MRSCNKAFTAKNNILTKSRRQQAYTKQTETKPPNHNEMEQKCPEMNTWHHKKHFEPPPVYREGKSVLESGLVASTADFGFK